MYKYFSEGGSHATFTALQPRLRMKQPPTAEDPGIAVTLGGRRDPARQVSIVIYCILVMTQALIRAVEVFEDRLNAEDTTKLVSSTNRECAAFFGRFLDSVGQMDEDLTPLRTILSSWQAVRDKGPL